jgi:hypothetical protein
VVLDDMRGDRHSRRSITKSPVSMRGDDQICGGPLGNAHVVRIDQRLGTKLRAGDFCPRVVDRCLLVHNHLITTDWN